MNNKASCRKEILLTLNLYTTTEQKILLYVFSLINPQEIELNEKGEIINKYLYLNKKELSSILKISSKNFYTQIVSILEGIANKGMSIKNKINHLLSDKDKEFLIGNFLLFDKRKNENFLRVEIPGTILRLFKEIDDSNKTTSGDKVAYTNITIRHILPLTSKYSLGLYNYIYSELYKQEKWGRKITLTPGEINNLFLTNLKYRDMKRSILQRATTEINNKTELKIGFEEHFLGKKIDNVHFFIKKGTNRLEFETTEKIKTYKDHFSEEHYIIFLEMVKNGISEVKAFEIMKNESILKSDIMKNIHYVNELENKNYPFKTSYTSFLVCAIEKNYNGSSRKKKNDLNKVSKELLYKEAEDELRKKKKLDENRKKFKTFWESLSDEKRNILLNKYKEGKPMRDTELLIKTRISSDYLEGKI